MRLDSTAHELNDDRVRWLRCSIRAPKPGVGCSCEAGGFGVRSAGRGRRWATLMSSNWRGGWSSRASLQRARISSSTLPVPCSGSPCIRIDPQRPHCSLSSILDSRYSHLCCSWLMIVSFSKSCCFRLWFVLTRSFTASVSFCWKMV